MNKLGRSAAASGTARDSTQKRTLRFPVTVIAACRSSFTDPATSARGEVTIPLRRRAAIAGIG